MIWIIASNILFIIAIVNSVEVHFESPDSGFFLKHSPRQSINPAVDISNGLTKTKPNQGSILSVDRFTIVQTTQPVSIRASYGPFSTKQTVPARFIVPDALETQSDIQNASAGLLELQQSNVHLDISAHLVSTSIPRDSPVLRVLFHAGADPGGHLQRQKICVLLHVAMDTKTTLKGKCMPDGEDGVCVAEVVIPSNWWSPLPPPDKNGRSFTHKVPQKMVQVSYSVFEPPSRNPEQCEPKVQIQPLTQFGQVPLVAALTAYKELRADDTLTILIPHQPLYPMSRIHVPVFLQPNDGQNVAVFIVRARVKAGMKILGATASSDQWNISVEKENSKHTVARVTAFRKDQDPDSTTKNENIDSRNVVEVFSWLLEVANDTKDHWDGGRIVWSVSYVHDGPKVKDISAEGASPEESRKKMVAKLEIQKDDIQAVLPIAKNWDLMNTAVLTGRQVSQAMKVFIVSQGGKVADVTLQSSCHADDESVIKVSSSCSSVYVDGSEVRGSSNASIVVQYGTYTGLARFIVWMPEFPLEVAVADFRLSQIKGWKIIDDALLGNNGKIKRRKRAYGWNRHIDDFVNGISMERSTCRARYQQSSVEIYARFLAVDQDSGRVSYLISRRTGLRVTDLVLPLLRIADPKIASLRGRILQGRAMGRTDIQVLSPITGRVIGAKEIRVGSDRVSITRLVVRVVSGLQLNITPDSTVEKGYMAETSVTRKLTAQYQEGLLDIDLEFSDGARTPLRDISVDDYFLLVESLDTEVVAFAPMLASHHPRVIAVGEGNGDLLRVTLLLSEECRLRRNVPLLKQGSKAAPPPLATALASVQVNFNSLENPTRSDTVQNDGISGRDRKSGRDSSDLADILIGIPLKDDSNHEPSIQARQYRGGVSPKVFRKDTTDADMTSLEIGMYVLLTAFCCAIVVFVLSCVVYASKFKPNGVDGKNLNLDGGASTLKIIREPRRVRESTTNAHDWVWLGRSTMDRSSMAADNGNGNVLDNQRESRVRITSNPITMNYSDPNDALVEITCLDNPNHIHARGVNNNALIDSSTYNKKDRVDNKPGPQNAINCENKSEYRPPVPPHRNFGVTANTTKMPVKVTPSKRHHHHAKHHRESNGVANGNSAPNSNNNNNNNNNQPLGGTVYQLNALNLNQHNLNHAESHNGDILRKKDSELSRNRNVSNRYSVDRSVTSVQDLHMAEKLVECAAQQQKSAFQFDTITPKENTYESMIPECQESSNKNAKHWTPENSVSNKTETSDKNSEETSGIGTTSEEIDLSERSERGNVVGNPMFAEEPADDLGPTESLGLDDLDMDYEQIMHYFDNLKESNA